MDIVKEIRQISTYSAGQGGVAYIGRDRVLEILERAGVREGFPIEPVISFIESMAKKEIDERFLGFEAAQAREINALIKPVDPDLIKAREMAENRGWISANSLALLRSGGLDGSDTVNALFVAIKWGRALASEQAS